MNTRLRTLFEGYINKTATDAEMQELTDMISNPAMAEELKEWIGIEMEQPARENIITAEQSDYIFNKVIGQPSYPTESIPVAVHQAHFLKTAWFRYAAAILILLAVGAFFFSLTRSRKTVPAVVIAPVIKDIAPGGNKALLTLADGTTILLDSVANGSLARQGNTQVVKLGNGQLVYKVTGAAEPVAGFNTMSTPRGGQYQLQLPDGTKVWLNASSSITYPTMFTGAIREVDIKGEAYFEVAKNPAAPFRVHITGRSGNEAGKEVEVIGTHFNVNSYQDEPALTVTLLEGAVKIDKNMLRPGEAYSNGKVSQADVEKAVAWKNGYFQFNQADIKTVMRQIARWYDVDISYEGNIPDRKFGGDILRESNLSDVLRGLEVSQVHFRIEGKKLIIMP
ncbi:MAG: FecR family protein [Flavitalea sp.]